MIATNGTVEAWRSSLSSVYHVYETRRPPLYVFGPALFVFFVLLNDLSYWLAMVSAFPHLLVGQSGEYYFKIQFPVATMGALFDTLSFFVTLQIVRNALAAPSASRFMSHLAIDLVIAILATLWVLFVFAFSSWLIRHFDGFADVQGLAARQSVYQDRAIAALQQPTKNLRNIYFGLILGMSAMLPSLVHLSMAMRSAFTAGFFRRAALEP